MSGNELFPQSKDIKVNVITDEHSTPYGSGETENDSTLKKKEGKLQEIVSVVENLSTIIFVHFFF